ncbi:MAG: divergent polysaccharide deacetylase family protein [Candidatus Omnitrophota bacterium]
MNRILRILFFVLLVMLPIVFYKYFHKEERRHHRMVPFVGETQAAKPKIALIFDDLGERMKDLEDVYELQIPVAISVIPGLKFSKNVAHIGLRCGFSILIHLPLEPKKEEKFKTNKYKFISSSFTRQENEALLRNYLNYLHFAVGVNNHMGSAATENPQLMELLMIALRSRNLVFIDSRTSLNSVACEVAKRSKIRCGYNEGFLDAVDEKAAIEKKLEKLIQKAREKGKIIIIAHPKKNTFLVLKEKLPAIKAEVEFISIKKYFGLE